MSFLETLSGYQSGNIPDLAAVVGSRIFPVKVGQGTALPYGVFTQISNDEDIVHSGKSGWGSMRVQYDFYAAEFHKAYDAARALRSAFEGKSVQIATSTLICFCRVETEFDEFDHEERIYRRSLDLLFEYTITT